MANTWTEYQTEAAELFRGMGAEADINVTIKGIRTTHQIDVLVKSHHVGFDVLWLVECKHWQTRVSKLHVLALREIVADVGADRGILLCEVGFQGGAIEAARLTNVHVTSIADIRDTASSDILAMRLRELYDRIEVCKQRYWDLPKEVRIKHGLRPDVGAFAYSGTRVIDLTNELVTKAFRGVWPIQSESLLSLINPEFPKQITSAEHVIRLVEPMICELEAKLKNCNEQTQ